MQHLWSVDAFILMLLAANAVLFAWLFRRYTWQSSIERRLATLFPGSMSRHMESIARERPFNYVAMHFLMILGVFGVVLDITGLPLSPLIQYGTAAIASIFALYTTRFTGRIAAPQA